MTRSCELCHEPCEFSQSQTTWAHGECMLRMVLGGIGHLIDHAHFCGARGDPDAGLSYRHSALLVDAWVRIIGVDEPRDSVASDA